MVRHPWKYWKWQDNHQKGFDEFEKLSSWLDHDASCGHVHGLAVDSQGRAQRLLNFIQTAWLRLRRDHHPTRTDRRLQDLFGCWRGRSRLNITRCRCRWKWRNWVFWMGDGHNQQAEPAIGLNAGDCVFSVWWGWRRIDFSWRNQRRARHWQEYRPVNLGWYR